MLFGQKFRNNGARVKALYMSDPGPVKTINLADLCGLPPIWRVSALRSLSQPRLCHSEPLGTQLSQQLFALSKLRLCLAQ
jgi:hypothetical protein